MNQGETPVVDNHQNVASVVVPVAASPKSSEDSSDNRVAGEEQLQKELGRGTEQLQESESFEARSESNVIKQWCNLHFFEKNKLEYFEG